MQSDTDTDTFDLLEQALRSGGSASGFDFLGKRFREEKNYPMLFEARLMQKRVELGLDHIQTGSLDEIPAETRPAYERAFVDAAREVLPMATSSAPGRISARSARRRRWPPPWRR